MARSEGDALPDRTGQAIEQLYHDLTNHPPVDPGIVELFDSIRGDAKLLGRKILESCPPSRERSLAITNLEQTVMWAIASLARNQVTDS